MKVKEGIEVEADDEGLAAGSEEVVEAPEVVEAQELDETLVQGGAGPESEQTVPNDGVKATSIEPVANSAIDRARRIAHKIRTNRVRGLEATAGPVALLPEPHREPGHPPALRKTPKTGNHKHLKVLATRIISEVAGLFKLLDDALARKLMLGQLLVEARAECKTLKEDWAKFLVSCKLNERTAREAIQFFQKKDEIEQKRHDGAVLTVTAVRTALSRPRARVGIKVGTSDPVADRREVGAAAPLLALPSPSPRGGEHGDAFALAGSSECSPDDRVADVAEGPETPPIDVEARGEEHAAAPHLDHLQAARIDRPAGVEGVEGVCEAILRILAEQIALLESGETDPAIEPLRRAAPEILEGFRRLDDAHRAIKEVIE